MKNPMTPAGIEPATFRFVTQHLNHCATAVPLLLLSFPQNRFVHIQVTDMRIDAKLHSVLDRSILL